jgi:hypothetical protein
MGIVHKTMMALNKKMALDRKVRKEWTDEDEQFAETYGGKVNFIDRDTIAPIVEYVRGAIDMTEEQPDEK